MNLYIGDIRFGHENVINFDNCPFGSVQEMDDTIIKLWNNRVSKADNVFVLGDFAYRNEKPYTWYLKQLRGKKHLIVGNHDGKLLKNMDAIGYFESINTYLEIVEDGKRIVLFHYPIAE